MKENIEGLRNELRLKIDECNRLHDELLMRPLKVVPTICDLANANNHPKLTYEIAQLIKSNTRFWCKIAVKGEQFWVMPLIKDEQIFTGLVSSNVLSSIKFNDLIEFQSCDVFEINYNLD